MKVVSVSLLDSTGHVHLLIVDGPQLISDTYS